MFDYMPSEEVMGLPALNKPRRGWIGGKAYAKQARERQMNMRRDIEQAKAERDRILADMRAADARCDYREAAALMARLVPVTREIRDQMEAGAV